MTSLDAFTVFIVLGTIALTVFTLRSHYRAHEGASSRLITHAVALVILFCAAIMVLAGVRWWLMPSWPSLAMPAQAAAAVIIATSWSSWFRPAAADTQ